MANKKISELPYIDGGKISGNTLVPLVTYYSATTGDTVHTYITDLQDYLISGLTGSTLVGDFLPLSGGTVTGGTIFQSGLTANTVSATTYLNLPQFSGGSGNCITDLYTSNIHSCSPLNINPLDEGDVYFGSTSGITVDVINGRIGIGSSSPGAKLDVRATGSSSSHVVFRIRNSGDTADLISFRGDGSEWVQSVPFRHAALLTGTNNTTQGLFLGYNVASLSTTSTNAVIIGRGSGAILQGNGNTIIGDGFSHGTFSNSIGLGRGVFVNGSNQFVSGSELYPTNTWLVSTGGEVISASNLRGLDFKVSGMAAGASNISAQPYPVRFYSPNGNGSGLGSDIQFHVAPSNTGGSAFTKNVFSEMFTIRGESDGLNHYQLSTPRIPSSGLTDGYIQYSNDITAGNAAPHFRTEAGNIVKLYTHSAVTTTQGIANALTTLGLLSASTIATSSVSGDFLPLSGGTVSGSTNFTNGLTANTISATTYLGNIITSISTVSGLSANTTTGNILITNTSPDQTVTISGGTGITTGGTYPNFTLVNSAPDQTVTLSGGTGITTGGTYPNFTITNSAPDQTVTLSEGTNISVTGTYPNFTLDVTGLTDNDVFITGFTYDDNNKFTISKNSGSSLNATFNLVSGLTVNGNLSVTGSTNLYDLSATTISATTYQNLPLSALTYVSGGTYSAGTITFTNTSGSTFQVTGLTTGSTSTVGGEYLPLSGGTVTGNTIFTSGLTASTLTVTGLTQTSGITSTGGIIFPHKTITANYTATTSDYFINITGGTFDVTLQSAVGVEGKLLVVKNEGVGIINVLSVSGQTIDDRTDVLLTKGNSLQIVSDGKNWVILGYNISSTQANTGVIQFSGLSIASPTTFTVSPAKGFIVDDTTNPVIPFLTYVDYTGGTHTATYVTTTTETWVYLTSVGTISQSNIELTEQQRRENIFLGKLGHANKTNIINAFSQPDFVLSPLSQLRDMFNPIGFINGGIYASPNGVNLSFNTSAGYLYGLGINFVNDTLNPNSLYVSGTTPCTFQYRTQTGGTASNTTSIDPTKWDVGGVVTLISGTKATNQRIYLVQNGTFRVQYGQTEYNQLSAAIEGIATEQFNTFSNFTNNGILIGVLSVLSTATDLSDTSKARFFFTSKFGETVGAAGGISTTTLQQAYNNSTTPEITTNSTLGPLSVKNGAGTLDNVTNVFEGVNSGGTTTSYVRADGFISGNSLNAPNLIISGGTQSIFSGNSSSDLVRITQTGVGNSFVVDDSTNPDSTPFVINSGGSVSIGTTSVFSVGGGSETKLNISTGSSGVATTGLSVSTPVIIESTVGTSIGLFNPDVANSQMYFGTPSDAFGAFLRWDYTNRNLILSTANGTGKLIFQTANSVEAARIDQSGNMGIGLTGATQKFEVSGNSVLNGSVTAGTTNINGNLTVTGNTNVRAFTGTTGYISGSGQNILTVIGSGNSTTSPLFTVQGSSGELFSVNDSLVGSLFSVNDISGLPILEVFSDNTTLMGSYQAPSLNTTTRVTLTAGTNTVYSIPTSAYTGAFIDYTLVSTGTTGARAGNIMTIWSGSTAQYTETSTNDIGNTTGVTFSVAVSGNNAVLSSSATTTGWTLKTIVRSI
jgi:hypothetical protein